MSFDKIAIALFKPEVRQLINDEQATYNPNKDEFIDSTEIGELLKKYGTVDVNELLDESTNFWGNMGLYLSLNKAPSVKPPFLTPEIQAQVEAENRAKKDATVRTQTTEPPVQQNPPTPPKEKPLPPLTEVSGLDTLTYYSKADSIAFHQKGHAAWEKYQDANHEAWEKYQDASHEAWKKYNDASGAERQQRKKEWLNVREQWKKEWLNVHEQGQREWFNVHEQGQREWLNVREQAMQEHCCQIRKYR